MLLKLDSKKAAAIWSRPQKRLSFHWRGIMKDTEYHKKSYLRDKIIGRIIIPVQENDQGGKQNV